MKNILIVFLCLLSITIFGQTQTQSDLVIASTKSFQKEGAQNPIDFKSFKPKYWLYVKNRGAALFTFTFLPMHVIGDLKLDDDVLRFSPFKSSELPERFYQKRYPYNDLIKGVEIPYSEMKSVKRHNAGFVVRTKDGNKYRIAMNFPKKTIKEIRSRAKIE
jgi:hypothetical protein